MFQHFQHHDNVDAFISKGEVVNRLARETCPWIELNGLVQKSFTHIGSEEHRRFRHPFQHSLR